MSAAELLVRLKMQAENFNSGLQGISQNLQRFGDSMMGIGRKFTTYVTLPIVAGIGGMMKAALDLEATEAKYNTVFAGMTDVSDAFIRKFQELTPATTAEARTMASGIQDLLIPMGFMREEATAMTEEFFHVTGALANFNSATHSAEDVANAMQSAIIGQYRPLAALGIQLDKTTIDQRAYEMGLVEAGEEVTKQVAAQVLLAEVYAQSGDALDAYTEASLDGKTKLALLKAEVIDVAANLGYQFLPIVGQVTEYLQRAVDWFKGLSDAQQANAVKIAALVAAVGPLLIVFGFLIKAVGIILGVLSLKIIIIGLIIAAVVAFVAVLANWVKENDELMAGITEAWEALKEAGAAIFEALKETVMTVVNAIKALWEEHGEAIMAVVIPVWEQVVNAVTTAIEIVKNIILFVLAIIRGDWEGAWNAMKAIGVAIWNYIKNTATNIFNALMAALSLIWTMIRERAIQIWENMKQAIVSKANEIRQSIIDAIQRAVDWIRTLPGQALQWGRDLIQGFINGVRNMASALVDAVKGVIGDAIDGAKNLLGIESPSTVFYGQAVDVAQGFINGLRHMQGAITDTMSSVMQPDGAGPAFAGAGAASSSGAPININLHGLFAGANITIGSENDAKALVKQIYEMASGMARSEGYNLS